jgi:hypothetical protein
MSWWILSGQEMARQNSQGNDPKLNWEKKISSIKIYEGLDFKAHYHQLQWSNDKMRFLTL